MDYNKIRQAEKEFQNGEKKSLGFIQQNKKLLIICAAVVVAAGVAGAAIAALIPKNRDKTSDNTPNKPAAELASGVEESETPPEDEQQEPQEEQTEEPIPTEAPTEIPRRGTAQAIPDDVKAQMAGKSMPSGASVTYDQLSYLTIPIYDFNYNVTEGHLVVSKTLAEEVLDIFAELFDIKYPIQEMSLIDKYNADDYTSIEHNNTSSFCYRLSTGGSGKLSMHAYGRAIDINPQINPYVSGNGTGAHENAREYWSRDVSRWTSDIAKAAYIGPGTKIYQIFTSRGWTWGGNWSSYRDYQHFEK
ncbi:MAG: M15 family metallopeptidase [Oscillospiraceae bacterium]|nr:M15 family metallopeptidase [Oscillospiraceae bacterium]